MLCPYRALPHDRAKNGHVINVFLRVTCPIFFTWKHSKDFGGSLEDPDVVKLCGCSRNSYYKYKRELKFV